MSRPASRTSARRSVDTFFRAGVGACVVDPAGRVLALRRKRIGRAAWQMPQGGIEADETPREALWRELAEETGLAPPAVELVAEHPDWLVYELPPRMRRPKIGRGQAQKWFLVRASADARVTPDNVEFDKFDWMTPDELLTRVIAFRRPLYERVFASLLPR